MMTVCAGRFTPHASVAVDTSTCMHHRGTTVSDMFHRTHYWSLTSVKWTHLGLSTASVLVIVDTIKALPLYLRCGMLRPRWVMGDGV